MAQKKKNGNILSFFQPAPNVTVTREPSPPHSPSSQPFSSPLALRSTPQKLTRTFPEEIGASDDESDSNLSDDSFADLSTFLGQSKTTPRKPTPTRAPHNNPFTPSGKRTALEPFTSPVQIKHKFDLKALAKDAKRDDATIASSIRNQAIKDSLAEDAAAGEGDDRSTALVDIVNAKSGHDANKVLRAVKRADAERTQKIFSFFQRDFKPPQGSSPPRSLEKTPWKLFAQGNMRTREQHLASGLAYTMSCNLVDGFPDEFFEWMVHEVCTSDSLLLRDEYSNLISTGSNQIRILITPKKLEDLFEKVGANEDIHSYEFGLTVVRTGKELYDDRDWSHLKSLLALLKDIANDLHADSITYAATTLVRMSMDRVIITNMDLLTEYEGAVTRLLNALPFSSWNEFVSFNPLVPSQDSC